MQEIDIDQLMCVVDRIPQYSTLTPAERAEVVRIAQGFQCKDSASASNVSPETVRARRKHIYRKLNFAGSGEVVSALLACSLELLGNGVRLGATNPANAASPGPARQPQASIA